MSLEQVRDLLERRDLLVGQADVALEGEFLR